MTVKELIESGMFETVNAVAIERSCISNMLRRRNNRGDGID